MAPVHVVGDSDRTGTIITFKPDGEIFTTTTEYSYSVLSARLRELAYLNKGVKLTLRDARTYMMESVGEGGNEAELQTPAEKYEEFYSEKGLMEFVTYLDGSNEKLTEAPIYL